VLWILAAGSVLSATGTWILITALRRWSVLDIPNERSTHRRPVPRGGGAALAAAVVVVVAVHGDVATRPALSLVVAGLGAGTVGLADDLRGGLPIQLRLVGTVLVSALSAGLAIGWDPRIATWWAAVLGASFWILAFVNIFNFMDGINGIAASQAIIAGIILGLVAYHEHAMVIEVGSFGLAAAALGFLPLNFPVARIFLGDVGSYFVGAWLAALVAIALRRGIAIEAVISPVALFCADSGVTLARRVAGGEKWYKPHRKHVYQRLVDGGLSQSTTTVIVTCLIAACSALGLVSLDSRSNLHWFADAGTVLVILAYFALPRLIATGLTQHRVRPAPGASGGSGA
jgi:UDP-GlcNAc:undecaprenyl-phosphate/decaprenyl-phosphate GlcNAc-1-phosphate transferase